MKIFSCNANNSNSTHSLISCNVPPKLCSTLVSLRTRSKRIGGPKREHLTPSIRIPRLILFSRKRVFKTVWYRLRNREIHALDSPSPSFFLFLSLPLATIKFPRSQRGRGLASGRQSFRTGYSHAAPPLCSPSVRELSREWRLMNTKHVNNRGKSTRRGFGQACAL